MSKKYKYTMAKQVGGDDGFQWAVFVKYQGGWREKINGLTKREVAYYRDRFEKIEAEKKIGEDFKITVSELLFGYYVKGRYNDGSTKDRTVEDYVRGCCREMGEEREGVIYQLILAIQCLYLTLEDFSKELLEGITL